MVWWYGGMGVWVYGCTLIQGGYGWVRACMSLGVVE